MAISSGDVYQMLTEANMRLQSPQSGIQDIFKQLQAAQDRANQLNEQRYKEILAQYEHLGEAGRTRIQKQTEQQQAAATQSLIGRGLGSTTITSAVSRGIASDAELQRQQLEESVSMQKAGVMERRTDVGPDLSMYANLLQSASRGGGGGFIGLGPMASRGLTVFGRPFKYT